MTERIFVDTSAWYAAADSDDRSHERASSLLRSWSGRLVTSDHVLIETWFLTAARLGRQAAESQFDAIRSGVATVATCDLGDLVTASAIGAEFSDQDFSIVDRTSWSVMLRLGIHRAISLDADFSVFRFGVGRRQSFAVER